MGTETGISSRQGKDWASKVRAYTAFYESGQYTRRYEMEVMRVLTVTTGKKRLKTLKTVTEAVTEGARQAMFWFSTFDQVSPNTVLSHRIWEIAGGKYTSKLIE
jgi:hypothetical protein